MPQSDHHLPGFKPVFTGVALMYIVLGGSMVVRGAHASMAQFGVPEAVLSSPHFRDFFQFLFVHMMVLGLTVGMLGRFVDDGPKQRLTARIMCSIQALYTYLDVRTSDSFLGNGLYQGPGSLVPVMIDVTVMLCFAYLSVRPLRAR